MNTSKTFVLHPLGILIFLTGFLSCSTSDQTAEQPPEPQGENYSSYLELITADFLEEEIRYFAGDEMRGRGTGSETKEEAAEYLADFQQQLGLFPAGEEDSYFQRFELDSRRVKQIAYHARKMDEEDTVTVHESVQEPGSAAGFSRIFGGERPAEGEVAFAGFGVRDEERSVDHLGNNLNGKWVMVYDDIPHVVDGDTLVTTDYGERARFNEIMSRSGAAGMLLITTGDSEEYRQESLKYGEALRNPVSIGLPYQSIRDRFQGAYMSVSPEMAATFLDIDSDELAGKQERLTDEITEFSPYDTGYHLSSSPEIEEEAIEQRNVAAMLEGSDPELKDEVIVITAHYDHMGTGIPDEDGDYIYNGADDNASGSISLLAMAQALSKAAAEGDGLNRSVLFLHVAAEEWGLLGSRYYSDHPTVTEENIVANINVDMIGRWDERHQQQDNPDFIYIIGADIISSDLHHMLENANYWSSGLDLSMRYNDLDDPSQLYRRSDHWSFGRLEIPFIFFFSGLHDDYHLPGDTPDKILYDTLAERVRLITATTIEIANAPEAPEIDSQEFLQRVN